MEIVVAREEILNHLRQRLYRKVSIADLEVLSLAPENDGKRHSLWQNRGG